LTLNDARKFIITSKRNISERLAAGARMTAKEILEELKPLGRESDKRVLMNNHGVKEPRFGVAISELKQFQKHSC